LDDLPTIENAVLKNYIAGCAWVKVASIERNFGSPLLGSE